MPDTPPQFPRLACCRPQKRPPATAAAPPAQEQTRRPPTQPTADCKTVRGKGRSCHWYSRTTSHNTNATHHVHRQRRRRGPIDNTAGADAKIVASRAVNIGPSPSPANEEALVGCIAAITASTPRMPKLRLERNEYPNVVGPANAPQIPKQTFGATETDSWSKRARKA